MTGHSCNNDTCRSLNLCLDELLPYQEVFERIANIEESLHINIGKIRGMERFNTYHPLDLWGWANYHMVYQLPNKEFIHGRSEI